jgi:hypothetical protein
MFMQLGRAIFPVASEFGEVRDLVQLVMRQLVPRRWLRCAQRTSLRRAGRTIRQSEISRANERVSFRQGLLALRGLNFYWPP